MQNLDTTIVNTALPKIAENLSANPLQMHSIIVAYVLAVAVMLPASGWLADRFGIRNILALAIALFTLGSFLCALSPTLTWLNFSRIVQGIGGAMMVPVGRLTVIRIVPRSQFMAAMAFVTIPGQIGPLVGPALGGFFVEYVSWHWIFLINVPIGLIGIIAVFKLMPNYKTEVHKFDFFGFLLIAAAMILLSLALDHKSVTNQTWVIVAMSISGLSAFILYLPHAKHSKQPLFNLTLFKTPSFRIGINAGFWARIGSGMLPFITPLFLQLGLGYSPTHAGLMMIPLILGSLSVKRLIVSTVAHFGYRNVLIGSTLSLSAVVLLFAMVSLQGWSYLIMPLLFLQGMINSIRFTAMNTLVIKDLPNELASSGNTLLSMIMQLSMSFGVSIVSLLLVYFSPESSHLAHTESTHALFMSTYLCASIIIALPAFMFARIEKNSH